jgi:hypothetical protein
VPDWAIREYAALLAREAGYAPCEVVA